MFRIERAVFKERLQTERGLNEASAGERERHLASMVRSSGAGTARAFLSSPQAVVNAIKAAETAGTRRARHLAARDYLELCPDMIDADDKLRIEAALDSAFPGRVSPKPHLVDADLGGSKKQVRVRAPLSWADGERLIAAAARNGMIARSAPRDAALVGLHVRSGLSPGIIRRIDWRDVEHTLRAANAITFVPVATRHGVLNLAVHITAIQLLGELHRSEGRPSSGPVFLTTRRPRRGISASLVANIVSRAAHAAGFPSLDLRHLRAAFALSLLDQGMDELRVRDALGYERLRDFRAFVGPLQEAMAQIRTREFLVVPSSAATIAADAREPTASSRVSSRLKDRRESTV